MQLAHRLVVVFSGIQLLVSYDNEIVQRSLLDSQIRGTLLPVLNVKKEHVGKTVAFENLTI